MGRGSGADKAEESGRDGEIGDRAPRGGARQVMLWLTRPLRDLAKMTSGNDEQSGSTEDGFPATYIYPAFPAPPSVMEGYDKPAPAYAGPYCLIGDGCVCQRYSIVDFDKTPGIRSRSRSTSWGDPVAGLITHISSPLTDPQLCRLWVSEWLIRASKDDADRSRG